MNENILEQSRHGDESRERGLFSKLSSKVPHLKVRVLTTQADTAPLSPGVLIRMRHCNHKQIYVDAITDPDEDQVNL